jgi:hypothetical protein
MPVRGRARERRDKWRFPVRIRASVRFVPILVALVFAGALGASPSDRSLTTSGTISRIQSSDRSFAVTLADGSQARFVWTSDTKISGVLAPGARVTIRYEVAADGRNVAQQISVSRS